MSEQLLPLQSKTEQLISNVAKMTVLEALAEDTAAIGPSMSNRSTIQGPGSPDFDDQ